MNTVKYSNQRKKFRTSGVTIEIRKFLILNAKTYFSFNITF